MKSEQAIPGDQIKNVVRSSVQATEFNKKHLMEDIPIETLWI